MRLLFSFLICLFAVTVSAEQTVITDYDDARDNYNNPRLTGLEITELSTNPLGTPLNTNKYQGLTD